jgi:Ala-tRNA(Pro) deacylase
MPASREDLLSRLGALGIATTTVEHAPVFTVEEARRLRGDLPGAHTKNLFFKDKKDKLWLIVCLEDAEIDLKSLHQRIGAARLSFGKPQLLREVLGVEPGSVTPFALINDAQCRVNVVLQAAMMAEERLNFHPLSNTATTAIRASDLLKFIRSCGHEPRILEVA